MGSDLSATGRVVRARIVQSGDANLDRGVLESARVSRYAPEGFNRDAVAGRYVMGVDFSE